MNKLSKLRSYLPRETKWLLLLFFIFAVTNIWWLLADSSIPNFDHGKHLLFSFNMREKLLAGDIPYIVGGSFPYPPLVHLVGGFGTLFTGLSEPAPTGAISLLFAAMLIVGSYGTAYEAFGRKSSLAAAVFSLSSPLLLAQLHTAMVDAPTAGVVAVCTWLMLASKKFENRRISFLLGVFLGLGMLTKPTFVIYVIGMLVATTLQGGWRQWRNLLLLATTAVLLCSPWYIYHFKELSGLTQGASSQLTVTDIAGGIYPSRWSSQNFGWYFWSVVNQQLFLPLTLLFIVGLATLAYHSIKRRSIDLNSPKVALLAGLITSYLLATLLITLKDVRYMLGALVYISVFATGWLTYLSSRAFKVVFALLAGVFAINLYTVNFGISDHTLKAQVPLISSSSSDSSVLQERHLVLLSDSYIEAGYPVNDRMLELLKALKADGASTVEFEPGAVVLLDYNVYGLRALARVAGLEEPKTDDLLQLDPDVVFMQRVENPPSEVAPCIRMPDGAGIYLQLGPPNFDVNQAKLICPYPSTLR